MASEWERVVDMATGFVQRLADQAKQRVEEFADAQAEGIWKQAEHDLRVRCEQLGDSLHLSHGSSGGYDAGDREHPLSSETTFRLPSRSYASVADEAQALASGEGEISVTVHFHHIGTQVRYSAAITRRDVVLRAGPSGVVNAPFGVIAAYAAIKDALAEVDRFIDGSGPFIREQLLTEDTA
ncbi:MAG TPA: hypothetical protein VG164_14620 [Trebonia sp.]|nr:hypothetical protein [Trebonia sp.]